MHLTPENYDEIKDLLYIHTGIALKDNKQALVEARLTKYLTSLNMKTFNEYLKFLKANNQELTSFINSLTTNKTEFFRENEHFKYLTNVILKDEIKNKSNDYFNVWSAASSTGEEVYSLAICLAEFFGIDFMTMRILGTDLDTNVLSKAQAGVYKSVVVKSIDAPLVNKYFERGAGSNEGFYKVNQSIKDMIKFRKFNLVNDEFSLDIKFDVIFLRNVLIYFDDSTIQKVVTKLTRQLKVGGCFFIGHSESLNRIKHDLKYVSPSVFQRVK